MAENPPPGGSQPPEPREEPPAPESPPTPPSEEPGAASPPPHPPSSPPPSYAPPPPPPPGGGYQPPPQPGGMAPPPPPPGGFAPPPGGYPMAGGGMTMAGNLASPGIRFVQGVIDVVILAIVNGIISTILSGGGRYQAGSSLATLIDLVIDLAYWGYFLSSRGQSIGMMPFNIRVQDANTGGMISFWRGVLRGFVFHLELVFCICIVGLIGLLWPFWDARKQAWHDKAASTIVVQG